MLQSRLVLALVTIAAVTFASARSRAQTSAHIPEPDITYTGSAPSGSVIAIEHSSGVLDMATVSGANPYVLAIKLVQPVVTPTPALPPDGSAYIGDRVTVLVNGVAQGQVNLAERGAIYRLDIPNPATTPSPNAILNPAQVVPTIPTRGPTFTRTSTPTGGTRTTTPTGTRTSTRATSGTATPSPTPTKTPGVSACVGDCNGSVTVTVEELVRAVNIALSRASIDQCMAADRNGSGTITVEELVAAVGNALRGCPQ